MTWLIMAAISFLLNEIAAFGASVDWSAVKLKVVGLVNAQLPVFMQPGVDSIVGEVVDCVAKALGDTADLKSIATDLINKDFTKALADLEVYLSHVVTPTSQMLQGIIRAVK